MSRPRPVFPGNIGHDVPPVSPHVSPLASDDGWGDRIRAHAADTDNGLPAIWTPEHVVRRMIGAFEVLSRMPAVVFPKLPGNGWPGIVLEFSDLVDADAARSRGDQVLWDAPERPMAHELSLMDEALEWPMRFLSESPLEADALLVFSLCKARDIEIAPFLRARHKRALAMIAKSERSREASLKRLAAEAAARANSSIAARPGDIAHAEAVRAEAHAWFRQAVVDAGLMPREVRPRDVMPGKIVQSKGRRTFDLKRKQGAALIAGCLIRAGVVVR